MKIHEQTNIDNTAWMVMRVPGGWIYTYTDYNQKLDPNDRHVEDMRSNPVFVPYSDAAKEDRLESIIKL